MPKPHTHWRKSEVTRLCQLVAAGYNSSEIAHFLGRSSASSVRMKMSQLHVYHDRPEWMFSAADVARKLGVRRDVPGRWIRQGYFPGVKRAGNKYRISKEVLWDFVARPSSWTLWRVEDITDPDLADYAHGLRMNCHLLTVEEVAKRLCFSRRTVILWIRRKLLPGSKNFRYWIPEDALNDFVPPCQRGGKRRQRRRFTANEDKMLRQLRRSGVPWIKIGCKLNRYPAVVQVRYQRITEREPCQTVSHPGLSNTTG